MYEFLFKENRVDVVEVIWGLKDFSWIWNGDGFFFFNIVFLNNYFIDLLFYIFVFFLEMFMYFNLFDFFGIYKDCSEQLMFDVFFMIK